MNKVLRYLIFVLLFAGIAYAVYSFMNKPAAKVEEVTTVVAEDAGVETSAVAENTEVAQETVAQEATEVAEAAQEPVAQEATETQAN